MSELEQIKRGAVELIPEDELLAKLKKGKPLKIKWGADPSAPDIHLGHTVVLHKLQQFQALGHEIIFIIGDFTARIGDPTGKSETRKPLTEAEVAQNAKTYQDQVFKVLDRKKTKVVYNSHWLKKLTIEDTIKLAGKYTVARMLERDDFMNRFEKERPISIHEFLYPLIQGYDSVEIKADVEVGGTDQKFNMLVGRELQREFGAAPQVILTMPLLEGTDGVQKMSKSLNNYIGVTEPPAQIFGKTMSISDPLMLRYYELLTDRPLAEIRAMHPKEAKKLLARTLVARFYSEKEAIAAEEEFETIFKSGGKPEEIETVKLKNKSGNILDVLTWTGLAKSRSDAKRLVQQGGVSIDNEPVSSEMMVVDLTKEHLLKVGKRRFLRVITQA
ncbi:MAG: tyrosine--tRNA ligase [Candidatus Margulisbacteria bacterium]|jgi:tyrosyl-tRNA synthetase|nr:tyrosine--tRNA ligase [Candidatus Margulisiibacteriota bacterium]